MIRLAASQLRPGFRFDFILHGSVFSMMHSQSFYFYFFLHSTFHIPQKACYSSRCILQFTRTTPLFFLHQRSCHEAKQTHLFTNTLPGSYVTTHISLIYSLQSGSLECRSGGAKTHERSGVYIPREIPRKGAAAIFNNTEVQCHVTLEWLQK